ncbi:aminoglycoside phosphotransferase family protein [Alkalihalobacillus pseudalcaliphilus]|uniref:aminoglycoside phosphotransferase family protein n=1 Tax=Alkalihalobacillus pseudalcaliphilus TaxID=79884 RepID=UPI00064D7C10|nr:aminoglycoside phosphotransferase family protein [Alkalihalobacillus pseudalcaliphilus]KMK77970.1 aminoglycoside phosphotransferase [Alkalihalobacillus pseudalcaliphilus]
MYEFIKQIPFISNCTGINEINKGFSSDKKYIIHMKDDSKVLLRMFDLEELKIKQNEFYILEKMKETNVNCSRPIEIGEVEGHGYMITSYIEGKDAEDEIRNYSEQEQFDLGYQAGKELNKMHKISAPSHISSWYSRKVEKHQKYMEAYLRCGIKIIHDHKILNFIDDHIELMKQRPNVFQHDDFHPGNMIVKDGKLAGIIDFNRYDWGDPIHEFLKIGIFTREISIPFSKGQIKGYFNNQEPSEDFWRLYSLYMAMCVFSTVVWTINTIPHNLNEMLDKVYQFLDDHNYFDTFKPTWYE